MKNRFHFTYRFTRCVYIFLIFMSIVAASSRAQAAPQTVKSGAAQTQVYEVARELVCDCPDCGKQALDQCPNCEIGRKYRAVIAAQLKEGRSKAQIINYFGDTYGEHILGTPRQNGFGRAAFTLPALAVLVGLLPLSLVLRRRKSARIDTSFDATPKAASSTPAADDPRVAQALRDYDF